MKTATPPCCEPSQFAWIYITLGGSLLLRLSLLDYESEDFRDFLEKWYDAFAEHGRWRAFETMEPHSVYPPLYMYLLCLSTLLPLSKLYAIKLISLTSDYVAAWFVWKLVRREFPTGRRPWAALTAFLFLPTVVMNGAVWGQCDVMYTACFLASLFYLLEGRPVAALVAFGLACSLKPQAIFWCPLLAGLLVNGRLPWKWIWVPPAVYVACGLPAVAAGWSFRGMLAQMTSYTGGAPPGLPLVAASWYQWVFEQRRETLWGAGVVLAVVATAFFVVWMREGPPAHGEPARWVVRLALISVLFPPFLLPGMHERYFFAADVLSVLYAAYVPRGFQAAVLVQFSSAFAYLPFLFGQGPVPGWVLPLPVLAALALVIGNKNESHA